MRRIWASLLLVLLPGSSTVLSSTPAVPAMAAASAAPISDPQLDQANSRLEGRRATVELAGGEVIRHLEQVAMQPATTSWAVAGTVVRKEVPTTQVRRVLLEPESRASRGFGVGCAVGGAAVVAAWSSRSFSNSSPAEIVATVIGAGFVGMLIGGSRRFQEPKVVYEAPARAPDASPAATLSQGAALEDPASGSGDLHCRLSRLRPNGVEELVCRPAERGAMAR